jgi:hypothetical protein
VIISLKSRYPPFSSIVTVWRHLASHVISTLRYLGRRCIVPLELHQAEVSCTRSFWM